MDQAVAEYRVPLVGLQAEIFLSTVSTFHLGSILRVRELDLSVLN